MISAAMSKILQQNGASMDQKLQAPNHSPKHWSFPFVFICLLFGLATFGAHATVTVTAATGGATISADTAANAASPAWTSLGPIVIAEGAAADFGAGTNIT